MTRRELAILYPITVSIAYAVLLPLAYGFMRFWNILATPIPFSQVCIGLLVFVLIGVAIFLPHIDKLLQQ